MFPTKSREGGDENGNQSPGDAPNFSPATETQIGNIRIGIVHEAGMVVPTGEKGMEANEAEPLISDADINRGKILDMAYHPHSGDPLNSPSLTYDESLQQYVKMEEETVWPNPKQDIRFANGEGWGESVHADTGERKMLKRTILPRIGDGKPHTAQQLYQCLGHWLRSPWNAAVLPWHPNSAQENEPNRS